MFNLTQVSTFELSFLLIGSHTKEIGDQDFNQSIFKVIHERLILGYQGHNQEYFWYPPNTTHNRIMALMIKQWPNARVLNQIMNHLVILPLITYKIST
jgi:hypothetical protein